MDKSLKAGFVEQVPVEEPEPLPGTAWYSPIFCVPQEKKNKFRLVYDASAKFHGTSLNDNLIPGPDMTNQLRSVLLRFREKPIAFGADIQSMFSNFKVPSHQHDLLRYFWYKDNDASNAIVPYRSTSHIFGCTSSPSVANYGLKYCAAQLPENESDAKSYIFNSFYVDDGFSCASTPD